jgi:KaiC/GvpD/RAD55 family RecA-like ATPase
MIPFLSELTLGGIRPGTILLVEFDPDSQWFAVSITMAGNVIQNGGNVAFNAMARSPEEIENELSTLGVDVPRAFKEGRLSINDWYSATLSGGRIEPLTPGASVFEDRDTQKGSKCLSLKVQDLSVEFLKDSKVSRESSRFYRPDWPAGTLNVVDSFSALLRFNDEKSTADYFESRLFPEQRKAQRITIMGLVRGIHSDWLYKRTEAATDGVVDIRVMEEEGKARNFVRVRSLRGQPHDSAWHQIEIKPNGEAGLVRS